MRLDGIHAISQKQAHVCPGCFDPVFCSAMSQIILGQIGARRFAWVTKARREHTVSILGRTHSNFGRLGYSLVSGHSITHGKAESTQHSNCGTSWRRHRAVPSLMLYAFRISPAFVANKAVPQCPQKAWTCGFPPSASSLMQNNRVRHPFRILRAGPAPAGRRRPPRLPASPLPFAGKTRTRQKVSRPLQIGALIPENWIVLDRVFRCRFPAGRRSGKR